MDSQTNGQSTNIHKDSSPSKSSSSDSETPSSVRIIIRDGEPVSNTHQLNGMAASSSTHKPDFDAGLSRLGRVNAKFLDGPTKGLLELMRNQYDADLNPNGIVVLGVADNALMRSELVHWFNHDKLHLTAPELTYGDRIFASTRLVKALCHLFNNVPQGLPERGQSPKLIQEVTPDHIVIGAGATGILDLLFSVLCNPGEGVLLSVPYYNGFDHDLEARSEAKIIEVYSTLPEVIDPSEQRKTPAQPSIGFTPDTVRAYEEAIERARKDGITPKVLLVCNPHNPTGQVIPRETLIALAKLALREDLHLVVDEIYAHSVYDSVDIPLESSTPFESILSIDVEKEASLPRGQVHVVTSASKDFGINGFRIGVYINQGNDRAIAAMTSFSFFTSNAAPAGALFYRWLEDDKFLKWYFTENHRRMAMAYKFTTDWARHHKIPYVPCNAGHFILLDLGRFLKVDSHSNSNNNGNGNSAGKSAEASEDAKRRQAEANLTSSLLKGGIFLAPGAQYHHPIPGWFRLTFSVGPEAIKEGLKRMEKVLGLDRYVQDVPTLDFTVGEIHRPIEDGEVESKFDQLRV